MTSADLHPFEQPQETAPSRRRHGPARLFVWTLVVGLVLFAAMAAPALLGYVYALDDLGAFHLPVRAFYARCLAAGEAFDWMPDLFCGFYLSGEGQAGMYHPAHLLLYRFLPLAAAFDLELLASFPVMFAGTWLFLRRLLGRAEAAMFGSLIFSFCGFNLLHFIHPNAVAIVAHLPWLLWAIDILATNPARRGAAWVGIALLTGSQLLLGYPQYVWFSLLAEGAYAVFAVGRRAEAVPEVDRAGQVPGAWRRRAAGFFARLATAKATGLLIGSVQLLPTIDGLLHSARRTANADFANWGSLDPWNLVQWIAPYLFAKRVVGQNTHELSCYLGAVPLVLLVWLFLRRKDLGVWRRPAAWAAGCGVLALLLAMGEHGGLYRVQRWLPLVGNFRFPCRATVLLQFCTAILAAISFGVLLRQHKQKQKTCWRELIPLAFLVGASVAVALAGQLLRERPFFATPAAIWAGPLCIGTACLLLVLAARGMRGAMAGLVLLAAIDLGCYGLSYSVYRNTGPLDAILAHAVAPPAAPGGRVLADAVRADQPGLHTGNEMTMLGWQRADGYAGLEPARFLDYRTLAALRIAGVEWVRADADASELAPGLARHGVNWLRVRDPLPYVRLVTAARVSHDPAAELAAIPVESAALTEQPIDLPGGRAGIADLVSHRPGGLHVQVDCPNTQLLVVAESFHPGWQARLDGRPRPVVRVNGDFLGCLTPPGRHNVELEFRPRSLYYGRILSWVGLGLAVVGFVGLRPRGQGRLDYQGPG